MSRGLNALEEEDEGGKGHHDEQEEGRTRNHNLGTYKDPQGTHDLRHITRHKARGMSEMRVFEIERDACMYVCWA